MNAAAFKVGDEVAVCAGLLSEVDRFAKVARVLATRVVLDDGTTWTADGSGPVPRQSGYRVPSIRASRHADHLALRRRSAMRAINSAKPVQWEAVDLDLLEAVAAKLRQP